MRPERITSRRNPLLQQIRRLLASRRARQEEGLFVGDGTKLLEEAARWYGGLETVILTDTLPVPELPPDTAVYQVPADVMESLSPMKTPQGALFLCRLQPPAPEMDAPAPAGRPGIKPPPRSQQTAPSQSLWHTPNPRKRSRLHGDTASVPRGFDPWAQSGRPGSQESRPPPHEPPYGSSGRAKPPRRPAPFGPVPWSSR